VSRYFAFGVLLTVIVLLIILFYQVMAGFFIPLFLAALLVVIFRPLHDWMLEKCRGRQQLAAGLTTGSICLLVFAPMTLVFMLAASEGRMMIQRLTSESILDQSTLLRKNLGLEIAAVGELRALETAFDDLLKGSNPDERSPALLRQLDEVDVAANKFQLATGLPELEPGWIPPDNSALTVARRFFRSEAHDVAWRRFRYQVNQLRSAARGENLPADGATAPGNAPPGEQSGERRPALIPESGDGAGDGVPDAGAGEPVVDEVVDVTAPLTVAEVLRNTIRDFDSFKTVHCGGKTWSWLKLITNPTEAELNQYSESASQFLRAQLPSIGGATTSWLVNFAFGLTIMIVALYFFLLDGPSMLATLKQISPLEEDHDDELIAEFASVSRAVVLATLLSAIAQGILCGAGLLVAGFQQVFLLSIITTCLALIPFLGAAAVWVPACVWLYAMENRMGAAIGLAVYGAGVVSMVDNLIKPLVLHGQSNLHPLLALLSVLGGISALGPIGLLIGPMIVVFLQTTLEILRRELGELDQPLAAPASPDGAAISTPAGNGPGSGSAVPVALPVGNTGRNRQAGRRKRSGKRR
jgi:predicted PurR-regulated permease PerM